MLTAIPTSLKLYFLQLSMIINIKFAVVFAVVCSGICSWLHLISAVTFKAALHAKYPWTFLAFDYPGEQTISNNWLNPHGQPMGELQNFPIFVSDPILYY